MRFQIEFTFRDDTTHTKLFCKGHEVLVKPDSPREAAFECGEQLQQEGTIASEKCITPPWIPVLKALKQGE